MSSSTTRFVSPELDLGNIVRLKQPHRGFRNGIIVEHVGVTFLGVPKVHLHLFDNQGRTLIDEFGEVYRFDTPASAFAIVAIVTNPTFPQRRQAVVESGVLNSGIGYFIYPKCPGCQDENQHPFRDDIEDRCPQCYGWGFVKNHLRLDGSRVD